MNWFRWYTGTATDPKFMVVARLAGQNVAAVVAVWAMLLERAADVTHCDASVTQGDTSNRGFVTGFDCEAADVVLGLDDGASEAILSAMEKKGLLSGGKVTNWEKRQPKREDSSAERTRAYRERLREKKVVTHCDASVTQGDSRVEESRVKNINIPPTLSSLRSERVSPTGDPTLSPEKQKRASSASVSRKPPTAEEVQAYCDERGNGISGTHFCDYYAAQGWNLSNGQPMRDWKAAVRNWEQRAMENPRAAKEYASRNRVMTDAERRQAHNDAVCRQVSMELDAMGGPF